VQRRSQCAEALTTTQNECLHIMLKASTANAKEPLNILGVYSKWLGQ